MPSQDPAEFSIILAAVGFAKLVKSAVELERILAADTPNQASRVRVALAGLESELKQIAHRTATLARKEIQSHELSSRVRPDTNGGGGPRLGDFIGTSNALDTVPGSVGINHEPTLEQENVGWWWTNEEGYSGHIGRTFIGAFDGTRPSPGDFRQHALLEVGKGVKGSGKGTIKRPIPERRFVRDGAAVAEAQWHGAVRAAKAKFMTEINAAMASSAAQLARKKRGRP